MALHLDPGLQAMPGDARITVLKTRAVPDRIDTFVTRRVKKVSLKVGTLTLK